MKTKSFLLGLMMLASTALASATTLTKQAGWYESAYVEWSPVTGATDYHVYYKDAAASTWTQIDNELVRNYGTYGRADVLGLAAGSYQVKVVPVISGAEATAQEAVSSSLTVAAHDRAGFGHQGIASVGAYNNDGTLKANAIVIYVYANNAKTVTARINAGNKVDAEGNLDGAGKVGPEKRTGLQNIISALEKGKETRPICIRIIGTIKDKDMDAFGSSAEGLQIKGKSSVDAQLTVEGVGEDATMHGFGILCRSMKGVEFRNFAIMCCMDDCLSLDTDNHNVWIHNMDFFYGNTGGDADQAKGDGTVDVKGKSSNITISYNHFWDSGKSSLGGMKSETTACVLTYHHNWFDHSDSRHPRIRTMFFHIYNNYFDGNAKYGVGMTMGGSALVERNYFRNCKYPMLISKQGTDATGDGTFSGEAGGVIVSYQNAIWNAKRFFIHPNSTGNGQDLQKGTAYSKSTADANDWDAYEIAAITEAANIPASIVCAQGGTGYSNTTIPYTYVADDTTNVKANVMANAGRINGGDYKWQFDNQAQDENYGVISALKAEIVSYTSKLVGFFDASLPQTVLNGGRTSAYSGGDSQKHENYVASYGGSDDPDPDPEEMDPFIVGANGDFYYFLAANHDTTAAYIARNLIAASTGSTLMETPDASDAKKYGYNIEKEKGTFTLYCPTGIVKVAYKIYRTGSFKGDIKAGNSATSLSKKFSYDGSKGELTKTFAFADAPQYVQITNSATGGLYIQGIKVYTVAGEGPTDALDNLAEAGIRIVGHTLYNPNALPLQIYNVQGTLLSAGNETEMSLTTLPNGLYIIRTGKHAVKILR